VAGDGHTDVSDFTRGDGGLATAAGIRIPLGVAVDAAGDIYLAEFNRIRMVTKSTGIITTVAGNGIGVNASGFSGDGGLATLARLDGVQDAALDTSGNIYIADLGNHRIRMVTKITGIITTVAGNGKSIYTPYDGYGGQATSTSLSYPNCLAVDASGNIYIAVFTLILMVTKSTGIITTVAYGNMGGFSGDGGLATSAGFGNPAGIAVDASGNIYFSDPSNRLVRMVTKSTGIITTIAGDASNPYKGYGGDGGLATSAGLGYARGIALDASGNIYIADYEVHRVRMVTKSTGIITTVAGDGTDGFTGDGGPATSAGLSGPLAVAVDASGSIYISDHTRLRVVTPLHYR
jgi:trimeric autotransporter adhesin